MNFTKLFSNINPREVIKNLPDAVFVVDIDGTIVWANEKAAIIFKTDAFKLKLYNFDELIENGLVLAETSNSTRSSVVTKAFTFIGNEIFVEINVRKFVDQYFITVRDASALTDIYNKAEQKGQLNKEKNIMITKLTNDFKSPIQSIAGFSQALLLDENINEKQNKYLKIIYRNANEFMYFISKFLEFSQAESSLFKVDNHTFNIVFAIEKILKSNQIKLREKNLSFDFNYENFDERNICSCELCLKIILQNIIENSIQMTDKGSINLTLSFPTSEDIQNNKLNELQKYYKLTVSNSGIGLSANEVKNIFEPYSLLKKNNKKLLIRAFSLGTAYNIVKKMYGAINIESGIMKGVKFNIILPIEKEVK